jgi:hypothetical protein
MQTDNALDALDAVHALMIRARAISTTIGMMGADIVAARAAGLLTVEDERFLAPHTIACSAVSGAIRALEQVLAVCELQPERLAEPEQAQAVAKAQRSITLAVVLVGDAQEYTDSEGPEDHL